jgi:hypothetical protein
MPRRPDPRHATPWKRRADGGGDPVKTVVWFGNAGSPYGDFGIPNLRIAREGLERASKLVPLKLLVVSNDKLRFEGVTRDFQIPCEFRTWSRSTAMQDIRQADVCIVPNSKDRFSLAKSANRIVLALNLGVPVVATHVPSAEPLRPFVIFDDFYGGVVTYLSDRQRATADVTAAQPVLEGYYSAARMAQRWTDVMLANTGPPLASCGDWLFFAEQEDDIRNALPLLRNAPHRSDIIGFTSDLAATAPDLFLAVVEIGLEYRLFSREEILRRRVDLAQARRVITWSGNGQRVLSRAMNEAARRRGLEACLLPEQLAEFMEMRGR